MTNIHNNKEKNGNCYFIIVKQKNSIFSKIFLGHALVNSESRNFPIYYSALMRCIYKSVSV